MKTTRNNILYYASTALIIETAISLGFALLVSLFGGILASWINRGNDVSGYFLGVLGFSIFFSRPAGDCAQSCLFLCRLRRTKKCG